jgi:hypothetical protein
VSPSVVDHKWSDEPTKLDQLAEALHQWPVQWPTSEARILARRIRGGDVRFTVTVAPGVVQLSTSKGSGWQTDRVDPAEVAVLVGSMERITARLDVLRYWLQFDPALGSVTSSSSYEYGGVTWANSYEEWNDLSDRFESLRHRLGLVSGPAGRSRCGEWSRKSRARMTRTLASIDWTPMAATDDMQPAMVTLTYPGNHLEVCPDGATAKRHLKAFRAWWERCVGPAYGCWKLERQLRGAAHFHLFLMVPTDRRDLAWLRRKVRLAWARIVGATGEHRRRHELAGVSIDVTEGARYFDPQRIAVYFSKHNAASADSPKDYQNYAPDGWLDPEDGGGVGRWWGYWRLTKTTMTAELTEDDAIDAARLLRGWVRSQGRVVRRRVRRVDHATGVVRSRVTARRYTVRALGGVRPSGFVLANDGAGLAVQLGRALTEPPDWLPGASRGIP